ncbi:stemmadenine O-acetyltransferase-like [Salvia miltiorrhiza]|uniref:stemmadenine O-acetyltransferase-like n=1 Tax=Salvia miltiorrhiza TaxID=226208 RepID=UPI0025AC972B|nr:stemmadenine O-acetyltransferase-like [Salvia miltiorrhiza]
MKIEVVCKEVIRPSSPTPTHLRDFKLSFIDERIPHFHGPLIIYYSLNENEKMKQQQQEMVGRLKSSLSDALVKFYPLAGRMKGQIFVDCNDDGILYVEAEADGRILDIIKSDPQSGLLDKLTPFITTGTLSTVEEPLAVQITSFICGGIALGMCISHRIADHHSLSSFTKCWAAIARRDHSQPISPVFNSAALFPPRNTPDFRPNFTSPSVHPLAPKLAMKAFLFAPAAVNALKSQITNIANPSRVEAVTAFLWSRCAAACRSDLSVACHPVNIRGKVPDLREHSFGNLFQMIFAENCRHGGGTSWIELAGKLRAAFGALDDGYVARLLGERGHELAKENFMEISKHLARENVEVFRFSSLCRFPVYEADFGWGKPAWVSYAGAPNKNCVFLFESVDMRGGVEAWVVMTRQAMERLQGDVEFLRFTSAFARCDRSRL